MEKKNYIVAIDVGTSEVVIAVGSIDENGGLHIEAVVSEPTEGMSAGMVDNSQSVGEALCKARDKAQEMAGIVITDAYVSISGKFVRCARYTDHVFVEDSEDRISKRDLQALSERMYNVKASDGEIIMDLYPTSYKGDNGAEMANPVGCYSKQLSSTYNFILCEQMAKDRLRRVFLDAKIKIRNLYAGAAIVARAVVNEEEMQEGVAVVDIGSGVTDVAVYYGGVLRYIASIPLGSSAINADLRVYDGYIPAKTVESLKCTYGSAVVEHTPDQLIEIRSRGRSIKPIQRLNLAAVIEARMTDIAEYVWNEIRESGYARRLAAGIVLTGGGANLFNVEKLFQKITDQEVRVSCAEMGLSTEEQAKVASPSKSLAVALLLKGMEAGACPVGILQSAAPLKQKVVNNPPKIEETPLRGGVQSSVQSPVQTPAQPAQPTQPAQPKVTEQPYVEQPSVGQPPVEDGDKWGGANAQSQTEDIPETASKGKGRFGGFWKKIKDSLDDAFRNPDEGADDGDDEY